MSTSGLRGPIGVLALVAALVGCGDSASPGPGEIILAPRPLVPQGLTLQLTATVVDGDGQPVAGQAVTFASDDTTIITVDTAGLLHSVGPLGGVRVTARSGSLTTEVIAQVVQRITSVTVPDSLVLPQATEGPAPVALRDFLGSPVPSLTGVVIRSLDTLVVAVDSGRTLRAKTRLGTTTIRVAGAGVDTAFRVRVRQRPLAIGGTLAVVLQAGESRQVNIQVLDQALNPILDPPPVFTSLDPGVFSVNSAGLVTGVASQGTGILRITSIDSVQRDLPVHIGYPEPKAITEAQYTGLFLYQAAISATGAVLVAGELLQEHAVLRGSVASLSLPVSIRVGATIFGIAVNHAGTRGYLTTDVDLQVIDLTSNQVAALVPLAPGENRMAIVSADDQTAYVGSKTRIFRVDLARNTLIDAIPLSAPARYLALDPGQQRLYLSDGTVRELDLATKTLVRTFPSVTAAGPIAVAPDGRELYVSDLEHGVVLIYSAATGTLLGSVSTGDGVTGLSVSSSYLVVSGASTISVYRRASRERIGSWTTDPSGFGGSPSLPAISPDERTIVVPDLGGSVYFIQ